MQGLNKPGHWSQTAEVQIPLVKLANFVNLGKVT